MTSLAARDSVVTHAASGRTATFGALAARAATFSPNLKPALKDSAEYRIVGTSKPRLDLPEKVNGAAQFGIDVVVPGMVYAAVALAPVRDAQVASVDDAAALGRSGVRQVINLRDAVAVIADSYWTASRALEEVGIDWSGGQTDLSSAAIRVQHMSDLDTGDMEEMDQAGDVSAALASGTALNAEYEVPYLAHATMEPMNCTVSLRGDGADIWVGHQNQLHARNAIAETLRMTPEQVTMHPVYLGGGFGRRGDMDFVTLAARIAQAADAPVKMIWSRETDMANDTYRPAIISRMQGAVENGRITAFASRYIDARSGMPDSERPFAFQYEVPNRDVARVICPSPVPVGTWRAVDFTQMGFFHESFVDELAEAAGADPFQFRMDHATPRRRAVLERLRRESGWDRDLPPGQAIGVAMVDSFETIVAQAVHVTVSEDRAVKVNRVISVVDCGRVINPSAAEAQVTGSVIFGLTSALYGEITLEGGGVQQQNFPEYDMLRLSNAPEQAVHFIASDHAPGGLGEPAVPPVTPALCNAIYRATGTRIRSLPVAKSGFWAA